MRLFGEYKRLTYAMAMGFSGLQELLGDPVVSYILTLHWQRAVRRRSEKLDDNLS